MLNAAQRAGLEAMIQSLSPDLHLEAAALQPDQSLELVLCRDFVCFRPLRIDARAVDISAALEGQTQARAALRARLQTALQGLL